MVMTQATPVQNETLCVAVHDRQSLRAHLARLESFVFRGEPMPLSRHPEWLTVLEEGLGHAPYCLEAVEAGETRGILPLSYVKSLTFGRFLVSLPYLNYGGVLARDGRVAERLIDGAVELARQLGVRYLELRHERPTEHPALGQRMCSKVHMRLPLPETAGALWDRLSPKVRNQVRKGQKSGLAVAWGGLELLPEFYDVLSHNMRDLGTPVFGRRLFRCILERFGGRAELCVTRAGHRAVAAALLLHGPGISEIPTAGSLRDYRITNSNMLMYWCALERATQHGQGVFDFGRSSLDSNTYRFKKQWGAVPHGAEWQYHLRTGSATDLRPENAKYQVMIRIWKNLPVGLTRLIGPPIVRGIP